MSPILGINKWHKYCIFDLIKNTSVPHTEPSLVLPGTEFNKLDLSGPKSYHSFIH